MVVLRLFWRKAAARFSALLFCILFARVLFFRSDNIDEAKSKILTPRFIDVDSIEVRDVEFVNSSLIRRDDFQCGPGNPCSNGACCGGSGYCGYGPTYCGDTCISNCNAVAECGQYASPAGKTCPLNTCCSQYGFCGTTSDFCGMGCQSNCVLNPSPPAGGSSTSILQNKVVGYYESWSARKSCHQVGPTDLPLDALTHVNYAFAYIDPSTYNIVTMDGSTPSSSFQDTANIKSIKPDLMVFVSVGGWTFSDNGTVTQPLYGEIAADAGKRQTFANNVVHFMKQYGFDGLDIDWEYPGAPDRGGNTEDTANYVLLIQTLRETFDASGGKFGLTFTAPTSYWYLRWFDLPNMIQYADWINLMSYDLHGVWDSTDPIGSIVQGHTNLSEIQLAVELFWRVNVPPAKIVMGFGFYGRSFTLSSSSCTSPGCPFNGASNPGPCTATGGILGYYEILDILNNDASITPVHDVASAVNYFTWDNNQWISYDDEVTFGQKIEWANTVGLGGAMIWASDLDDDRYTAHSALLGKTIQSNPSLQLLDKALSNPQAVIQDLAGDTGQNCFAYKGKCVNLNDNNAMAKACGSGFTPVGWDDAGCGKKNCHCGKPICCPTNQAPQNCIWRGDKTGNGASSDCSGQCNAGEINIQGIASSWGGGFTNDGNTNKCGRGYKVFCCPDPVASQITQGCYYASCRASCRSEFTSVFSKAGGCWIGSRQYCCPNPRELTDCHWVTKTGGGVSGDCSNARCSPTELEVDRDTCGDGNVCCDWGRKQAACCTVQKAPPSPATCSANLCHLISGLCTNDGNPGSAISKRDLVHRGIDPKLHSEILNKRGGQSTYNAYFNGYLLVIIAVIYPEISRLYTLPNSNQVIRQEFRLIPGYCIGPAIQQLPVGPGTNPPGLTGSQTEHPLDRQIAARFIEAAAMGLLRNRYQPNPYIASVNNYNLNHYWDHPFSQLGNAPAVGSARGAQPVTANDRLMEAFGSDDWPQPLMPTDAQLNGPKGNLMNLAAPIGLSEIAELARTAARTGTAQDADNLLQSVRIGFALFEYLNNNNFTARFNLVRNQVRTQLGIIESAFAANGVPVTGLQAWWDVFLPDYLSQIENWAQSWTSEAIAEAARPFQTQAGSLLPNANQIINTLAQWDTQTNDGVSLVFGPNYGGIIPMPQPSGG